MIDPELAEQARRAAAREEFGGARQRPGPRRASGGLRRADAVPAAPPWPVRTLGPFASIPAERVRRGLPRRPPRLTVAAPIAQEFRGVRSSEFRASSGDAILNCAPAGGTTPYTRRTVIAYHMTGTRGEEARAS